MHVILISLFYCSPPSSLPHSPRGPEASAYCFNCRSSYPNLIHPVIYRHVCHQIMISQNSTTGEKCYLVGKNYIPILTVVGPLFLKNPSNVPVQNIALGKQTYTTTPWNYL